MATLEERILEIIKKIEEEKRLGDKRAEQFYDSIKEIKGIPSGLIAIFDTACPSGWTRVAAFDSKFLRGYATYGGTGGMETHYHTVDPPNTNTGAAVFNWEDRRGQGTDYTNYATPAHYHTVNIAAFDSASSNSLPPYINVIFCKKN